VFYLVFARFREQACTFICPYGRFQSTMLDENTMVISYDHKRGEPRGPVHQQGKGDCIDCHLCVAVCPTGIDIRDGIQMECVNCTACIDVCDSVMDKLKRPRGLVRYASLNSIEGGRPFGVTPRMIVYAGLVAALAGLLTFLVLTRPNVEVSLLRAPGAMFQELPGGQLENLYLVQFINKTAQPMPVTLELEGIHGKLSIMGDPHPVIPAEQLFETSVLVDLPAGEVSGGKCQFDIGVYSEGKRLQLIHTSFLGPRD
jgi:cytochrome c oxidase accessory protein FixG